MDLILAQATTPRSRWLLARSVVFVAATLVLGQWIYHQVLALTLTTDGIWRGDVSAYLAAGVALLVAASLLVVMLGVRDSSLRRQPGFLIALAIAVTTGFALGHFAVAAQNRFFVTDTFPGMDASALQTGSAGRALALGRASNTILAPTQGAAVVAAVWVVLRVAGCWQPPSRSLLDRTGRAIGGAYLLLYAADLALAWLV